MNNDAGEISMSQEAKQNVWAEHYEKLLNIGFQRDLEHLSNKPLLGGPSIIIIIDVVKKTISKMTSDKSVGLVTIYMYLIYLLK